MTTDPAAIVTAFIHEFDGPISDPDRIGAYLTEDAFYHNVPMEPMTGRAAIQAFLTQPGFVGAGWEVKLQVAQGNVVMNERVDRFNMSGRPVAIPVMGVFEIRDGKIASWRDYFDMAMFQKQLAGQ